MRAACDGWHNITKNINQRLSNVSVSKKPLHTNNYFIIYKRINTS